MVPRLFTTRMSTNRICALLLLLLLLLLWYTIDRCMTGSVAEFVLTPIFHNHHHQQSTRQSSRRPAPGSSFACHVHPLHGYALYDVQYSVVHRGDVINDVTLTSRRLVTPDNRHPYRAVDKYAIIKFSRQRWGETFVELHSLFLSLSLCFSLSLCVCLSVCLSVYSLHVRQVSKNLLL